MIPPTPTQKATGDGGKNGSSSSSSMTIAPAPRGEVFDPDSATPRAGNRNTFMEKKHIGWLCAGLALLFCIFSMGAYVTSQSKRPAPLGPFVDKTSAPASVRVDVTGAVQAPGVYTLPSGSRVEDALQSAGGPTASADLSALNRAATVNDGAKIVVPAMIVRTMVVPTVGGSAPLPIAATAMPLPSGNVGVVPSPLALPPSPQTGAPSQSAGVPSPGVNPQGQAVADGAVAPSSIKTSPATLEQLRRNPVDLNSAGVPELALLPGVGQKLAERIVAYRAQNGGFRSVDELDNVQGFGTKRLESLQGLVRVQ